MSDSMRDGFGFAASGASQNQHRTIGCNHCFALLGIETREEIHYFAIFALGAEDRARRYATCLSCIYFAG